MAEHLFRRQPEFEIVGFRTAAIQPEPIGGLLNHSVGRIEWDEGRGEFHGESLENEGTSAYHHRDPFAPQRLL